MTDPNFASAVEEVKPCPFCGDTAFPFYVKGHYWYVGCLSCDCEGPPTKNRQEAIDKWNERV